MSFHHSFSNSIINFYTMKLAMTNLIKSINSINKSIFKIIKINKYPIYLAFSASIIPAPNNYFSRSSEFKLACLNLPPLCLIISYLSSYSFSSKIPFIHFASSYFKSSNLFILTFFSPACI